MPVVPIDDPGERPALDQDVPRPQVAVAGDGWERAEHRPKETRNRRQQTRVVRKSDGDPPDVLGCRDGWSRARGQAGTEAGDVLERRLTGATGALARQTRLER